MNSYGEETYIRYEEEYKPPKIAVVRQSVFNFLLASFATLSMTTIIFGILAALSLTIWNFPIICSYTTSTPTTTTTTSTTTTTTTTSTTTTATSTNALSQYITDIFVIAGLTTTIACPSGYTKVSMNLNQYAAGYYTYFCYTYNATAFLPITGIVGYSGTSPLPTLTLSSPWTYAPNSNSLYYPGQDLNQEVPYSWYGFTPYYVYFLVRRDTAYGPPLMKSFNVYSNPSFWCPAIIPSGWTSLPVNLNEGNIGICLYAAYQ